MAKDQPATDTRFAVTRRNRVARHPMRGIYDKEAVYGILDSAIVCHIAYVIDGQPYCTPTSFWREGDHVYWHGSSASRMIRSQARQRTTPCVARSGPVRTNSATAAVCSGVSIGLRPRPS